MKPGFGMGDIRREVKSVVELGVVKLVLVWAGICNITYKVGAWVGYRGKSGLEEAKTESNEMVTECGRYGVKVLFATIPPVDFKRQTALTPVIRQLWKKTLRT